MPPLPIISSIAMTSVDFDEIERLQVAGDWDRLTVLMTDAALKTEAAGRRPRLRSHGSAGA